jgi:acyl-CoA reductase-like NAD-dependent aldehyde dehydrogenase
VKIFNPANETLITEVAEDSPASVAAKVERARRAQPAWASAAAGDRLAVIARFKDGLQRRSDELARTLTREMGKPLKQARNELAAMNGRLEFFLAQAPQLLADEVVLDEPGKLQERIAHEPLGVVANVSAWNYPWFVGSNVFVPALLTGNAVVYKPSEHATLTGLAIADLLKDAGLPDDLFVPVIGGGDVGAALVAQPMDGLFFTGSYGTGRRIAQAAAGRMIKLQLELGGKDPVYVADDVDVRAAAEGLADGAFYNAGQSCCAVERLYVQQKIAEPFLNAFVETVRGYVVGDPEDENTYLGPLARREQLAVLEAQVADATSHGGRLLLGGQRLPRPGYYFAPTVLTDVHHGMKVMRDESFGPIIGLQIVRDDDEALRLMNDTEYGLTAGVYTRERTRAESLLRRVNAGTVYWNCCDRVSPRLPWTGRKHSGVGSTLSRYGIQTFLQPKAWHLRAP